MRNPLRSPGLKRALITGATTGIGRACAELLCREGLSVGILSDNAREVAETVAALTEAGGLAWNAVADLSKSEQVEGLIERLETEQGPLDYLINNAGIGLHAGILEFEDHDMRRLFEVNFFAMATLSRDALRAMAGRGRGHIINISSAAARRGLPDIGIYAATKGAMHAFTQALRVEAGAFGVSVSEALPMSVRTPFFENAVNRTTSAYESSWFTVSSEQVAALVWRVMQRPRPEIYTSALARLALALDGINPRWLEAILAAKHRKKTKNADADK